jgi:hypothetical protein
VHKEDIRLPNFLHFPTHAHPVKLRSIQRVDISNNISDIMMSRDRIPEIKLATAMFKVVNTPECYHDEKEDIKTEFIVPVNCATFM